MRAIGTFRNRRRKRTRSISNRPLRSFRRKKWEGELYAMGVLLLFLALLLVAGCGAAGGGRDAASQMPEKNKELLWPEPPLIPRIKYVGFLRSQNDLTKDGGAQFVDVLLGSKRLPDSLNQPMAIAPSPDGKRLYVSDYIKRGVYVFDFQNNQMFRFGVGRQADSFRRPLGITVDAKGNVYVVDSDLKAVRVFDSKGNFLRNIASPRLERPTGIALDPSRQRIYVADSSKRDSKNHLVHIFREDGTHLKTLGAGVGSRQGEFIFPTYLTVDPKGNVYVADTLNARIQVFDSEGRYVKTIGERGDAIGMFFRPKGIALDTFGNVYVVDSGWSNIQIFNQTGQVLLFFGARGRLPGLLFNPTGIAIDGQNRIYIADTFNQRVNIYQLINTTAKDSLTPASAQAQKGSPAPQPPKEGASK